MENFAEIFRITNPGKWVIIEKHGHMGRESHYMFYGSPEKALRQEFLKGPDCPCPVTLAHVEAQ